MRGELVAVWSETYREIWAPLFQEENVPVGVFSELYRELARVIADAPEGDAAALPLNDAIQLRETFDRAVARSRHEVELSRVEEAFEASNVVMLQGASVRRAAAEAALGDLLGDMTEAVDAFAQAVSEIAGDPERRAEARERLLDSTLNDPAASQRAFEEVRSTHILSERALVDFFESAFEVFEDTGGDALSNRYFNRLAGFLEKYSLRYELRRPCTLCPTVTGLFAALLRELRLVAGQDEHLSGLMREYEAAVRDLRIDTSDARIKTCIQKQINLLESLGGRYPSVTKTSLGDICDQVGSWPHPTVRESLKKLYGFASEYPGIRHGGNTRGVMRTIDMRDMIAMSILLVGYTPYLVSQIAGEDVYLSAKT